MEYGCMAVILTAVEIESRSVRHLFDSWKKIHIAGDLQEYYETHISRDGKELRIITCQQSVMGMTAATLMAAKAVQAFRPKYLILCGIAAGIGKEAEQMYGDVIVPDMIWDYSTGKFVGREESEIRFGDVGFLPRPVMIDTDEEIIDIVKSTQGREDNEFHVHIGPMACGTYVMANREMVEKRVKSLFPRTVGLDMESYSVSYTAANITDPKPVAIVAKSICDFANSEKSDQYQRFAAYTSSGYVKYLLEKLLPV